MNTPNNHLAVPILCLLAILVIAINVILVIIARQRSTIEQIRLMGKAARSAQQPWSKEDRALDDLSHQVANLTTRQEINDQDQQSPPPK